MAGSVADADVLLTRAEGKPVVVASMFQPSPQLISTLANVDSPTDFRNQRVMKQQGSLTTEAPDILWHSRSYAGCLLSD